MATTYTLITSQTLAADAANINLTSIPNTYTDLVLKYSVRIKIGSVTSQIRMTFNNDTTANYSYSSLQSNGSLAVSGGAGNLNFIDSIGNGNASTANMFTSIEVYIPNYTSTGSKPLNFYSAEEDNNNTAYLINEAGLYIGTSAISSIKLDGNGSNIAAGSSVYLYGIKNA